MIREERGNREFKKENKEAMRNKMTKISSIQMMRVLSYLASLEGQQLKDAPQKPFSPLTTELRPQEMRLGTEIKA